MLYKSKGKSVTVYNYDILNALAHQKPPDQTLKNKKKKLN